MEKLEKVELIREKTGVSYDDANVALEAANGDVLDAIIWLERMGKAEAQSAAYTTESYAPGYTSPEMAEAQYEYAESSKKSYHNLFNALKRLFRKGLDTDFVAERNGERAFALPILVIILGLFVWGATLWLLIIGLFFGFRYHIDGSSSLTGGVNKVMDSVGGLADSIKDTVTSEKDN